MRKAPGEILLALAALALASARPACAQRPDTLAQTYTDARLGLRLALPAGFRATPYPLAPPEPELTAQLQQLAGPKAAARASAVAIIRQQNAPHSTLTLFHLPTGVTPIWLALGFEAWRPGRYYRHSSEPPLIQELACALPAGGWLYLRADLGRAAYGEVLGQTYQLQRTLDILYGSRIFPALELLGSPPLSNVTALVRYADSLVYHAPGGNPLPALAALQEGRHAAAASFKTPDERKETPGNSAQAIRHQPADYASIAYLADALDRLESFAGLANRKQFNSRNNPDFISIPEADYGYDGVIHCLGRPYSVRDGRAEILRRVPGHRFVVFNENGYQAQHRTLPALLLPALYTQGFRYLAIGSLVGTDVRLNQQAYPTLGRHEYAPEYQFANLIRTARQLGFTLIGYANTTQPAGSLHTNNATIDHQQTQRHRYQQRENLGRQLAQLPATAKVVVLATGNEGYWRTDNYNRKMDVPLLGSPSNASALVIDQLYTEDNQQCIGIPIPQRPPGSELTQEMFPLGGVQAVLVTYDFDKAGPQALTPGADITVRSRLDAARLPLPYLAATNARPVTLDLAPYRATSATGRRVLQLYLTAELSGPHPEQVPPVFTHEIGPQAGPLTLQLCPGRYHYIIRATAPLAEVQVDITVPE